jgi:hypothetical protein
MKKEKMICDCDNCDGKVTVSKYHNHNGNGGGNAIYCLGVIGALFYFLQNVSGLQAILMGIGKAIFWPAILMFKLLNYLQI